MRVVVVGGGFCGSIVAKKLEKQTDLQVFLIDEKKYYEYTPSLGKILFDPSYHQKIIIPFSSFLKHTHIVTDYLVRVTPGRIETRNESFPFDYLVLCTGIEYPIYLQNKHQVTTLKSGVDLVKINNIVQDASHIIIIGGGVIGTELAGEFATRTPKKQVTLVHPHPRLLERNTPAVSAYAQKFLKEHGINIIIGERVVEHTNSTFITDKKREIEADIGFWCAGIRYNPFFMKEFKKSIFSPQHSLLVNQYLQLKGYPTIFIGGDLTNIAEEKTAAHANSHASIITSNIHRMIHNKPLISYHSRREPMIISLGCWDGIITLPPFIMVGFTPGIIKQLIEKIALRRL
jgi:NADH dehydrogenase FAD-containing subunit